MVLPTTSSSSILLHPSSHPSNAPSNPTASLLAHLAHHGVPAISSAPPWSSEQQDAAIKRGPHPSTSRQHTSFLLEDMFEFVKVVTGLSYLIQPYAATHASILPHQK